MKHRNRQKSRYVIKVVYTIGTLSMITIIYIFYLIFTEPLITAKTSDGKTFDFQKDKISVNEMLEFKKGDDATLVYIYDSKWGNPVMRVSWKILPKKKGYSSFTDGDTIYARPDSCVQIFHGVITNIRF